MIVRILGQGQVEVDDADMAAVDALDDRLYDAVEHDDETSFGAALAELHEMLGRVGRPLPAEHFGPSDLVLPDADATIAEVKALLRTHEEVEA